MKRAELLKEAKPILFNTEMVKAILEGRKTVTRRCVKPKSKNACGFYVTFRKSDNAFMGVYDYDENERQFDNSQTPPACVGDILYVRETWMNGGCAICEVYECYGSCGASKYLYKADYGENDLDSFKDDGYGWKSSRYMPKEAARIFLRVTDVRVERLQECGKGWCLEIEKEGVVTPQDPILYVNDDKYHDALREEFQNLWNSTIKKSDLALYGWEANPWVWVIEFERIEPDSEV